jgi:hypothetical protein
MLRRLLILLLLVSSLAACGAAAQTSPAGPPESVAKAALTALAGGDQATLAPLLSDTITADSRDDMRIQWRGSSCNTLQSVKVLSTAAVGVNTEVRLQAQCTEAVDGMAFTLAAQGGSYRVVGWRMLPFEELEK